MSIVVSKQELNFDALACRIKEKPNYRGMSIAYSIPEQVTSAIRKIEAADLSDEDKQQRINKKLLFETNHCGYFFDQAPTMNFRYLYLETCDGTLDTYIRTQATNADFQWSNLQEMCNQLVDAVAWLHQSDIYYDGQLHPRNVFVKTTGRPRKIKLKLSDEPNPFHHLDAEYVNSWSGIKPSDLAKSADEKAIQKDLVSVFILMYFIQSAGSHPFQTTAPGKKVYYQAIQNQINQGTFGPLDGLDRKCFCIDEKGNCEETQCKYRSWINMLAKDLIYTGLYGLFHKEESYTNQSAGELMQHPFFWKTSQVLSYVEKSSNYLKEAGNGAKKDLFCLSSQGQSNLGSRQKRMTKYQTTAIQPSQPYPPGQLDPSLLEKLKKNHKNIVDYLHERPASEDQNGRVAGKKSFTSSTIKNFFGLLKQIRNKSCHWNETSECGRKAKADLEDISFIAHSEMDGQVKFCLFWNIHIPSLILYTWENLKDVVALQ